MRDTAFLLPATLLGAAIVSAQQAPPQPAAAPASSLPSPSGRKRTSSKSMRSSPTRRARSSRTSTREDFEVYEDGRLQSPTVFSLVDVPLEKPFIPLNASVPIEPDVRATTRTFDGRIYILLLDDLHTNVTRTNNVREVAKKFINEYLGVNDLAAVVYTSGRQESGQELTSNRRLLNAAIDRFQGQKLPSAGAEKLALHRQQIANEEGLAASRRRSARRRGCRRRSRSATRSTQSGRPMPGDRCRRSRTSPAGWPTSRDAARRCCSSARGSTTTSTSRSTSPAKARRSSPKRRKRAAAAQRANVNVYGIDPRGMSQFGEMIEINDRSDYPQLDYGTFRGQLRELLLAQESLISLSDETGGIPIVNSGDLAGGLGRIVLDNSRYYVLGYYSDSAKWSRNKFLKIEVKVKRPGLRVRARKGFLPPDARAIARAAEADVKAGTTPALRAALSKPVPIGDLPMRVFAAPLRGTSDKGSVVIAMEIDGSALKFQERDGRFVESLEVSIVAADQRARVQGGDRQTFNLNLMPETHARVSRTGVRLLSQLELPPGRYQIRVGAHEATGQAVGTVPYDVEVPDYCEDAVRPERRAADVLVCRRADDGQPGYRLERTAAVAAGGDADVQRV